MMLLMKNAFCTMFTIWRFPKIGLPPSHPDLIWLDHFSFETYSMNLIDFVGPPLQEKTIITSSNNWGTKAKFVETCWDCISLPTNWTLTWSCISCQPAPDLPSNFGPIRESVPMARATSFTSAPVRSHNLRFTSAWDWKFSSLMTRAISVILKIHIDPRCSTFITCCSHLHHAGLCAPSWFGFHEPLLGFQDWDVLNSKYVLFVFSPRFKRAHTYYEIVG